MNSWKKRRQKWSIHGICIISIATCNNIILLLCITIHVIRYMLALFLACWSAVVIFKRVDYSVERCCKCLEDMLYMLSAWKTLLYYQHYSGCFVHYNNAAYDRFTIFAFIFVHYDDPQKLRLCYLLALLMCITKPFCF